MNNIFIGKKIKEARNRASMTQQCLADKINKRKFNKKIRKRISRYSFKCPK